MDNAQLNSQVSKAEVDKYQEHVLDLMLLLADSRMKIVGNTIHVRPLEER